MMILVDTCIWSYALRSTRRPDAVAPVHVAELIQLIEESRISIIGPIRQELLSGIKTEIQFNLLRDRLKAFPDTIMTSEDYETAASFFNKARSKGIQGSNTDFLLCALSYRLKYPIYTADRDFSFFSKYIPVSFYSPRGGK